MQHRDLRAPWPVLLVVLTSCFIDRTELACERAVTHLADCCDTWQLPDICSESTGGLWIGEAQSAAFEPSTAHCIRSQSCATLRPACAQVEALAFDTGGMDDTGWIELELVIPECSP